MLNRVTISALLKSVILVLCTSLVIILALGAWESWQKVNTANRIAAVADVSTHIFKALHNLRSDRSRTVRVVHAERISPADDARLKESREALVPALQSALATLRSISFPGQPAMVTELDQRFNSLTRLHAESLAVAARPKAERPAGLTKAMSRIEESSTKISDIIGVIDEIARQTNLLALNAAVEAARAGDAGRGFAVVASEVRNLAQRSSEAAKDIKSLIVNSTTQVQEGVDLVNRAGKSLEEIVESIKQVATIVSEIASASMEQSTGIDHVNTALTQMDEVTQQNAALVEENAATSKVLEQQSAAMSERVAFFKLGHEVVTAPSAHLKSPIKSASPRRAA